MQQTSSAAQQQQLLLVMALLLLALQPCSCLCHCCHACCCGGAAAGTLAHRLGRVLPTAWLQDAPCRRQQQQHSNEQLNEDIALAVCVASG
jgi:hypothetical protein